MRETSAGFPAAVLLLAAGEGRRMGAAMPKAFLSLGPETVIERSARQLAGSPRVCAMIPVVPPVDADADRGATSSSSPSSSSSCVARALARLAQRWTGPAALLPAVTGGATRQESVANGLRALRAARPDIEWVLVHDAARCMVEPADVDAVLAAAEATGAAIPVVPVVDTIKELRGDRIVRTADRSRLARAQTPQAFRVELLERALRDADAAGFLGTDCASLVERLGLTVRTCPGREANLKLTTPADLSAVVRALADAGSADPESDLGRET